MCRLHGSLQLSECPKLRKEAGQRKRHHGLALDKNHDTLRLTQASCIGAWEMTNLDPVGSESGR